MTLEVRFSDYDNSQVHGKVISYFTSVSITVPKKGRKKSLTLGQVGIGCSHCKFSKTKLKGCTYFPSSISGIYNATMIIQQRHFPVCPSVSRKIIAEYNKLKVLTARSASTKQYWEWAAKKLVSLWGKHIFSFVSIQVFSRLTDFVSNNTYLPLGPRRYKRGSILPF